MILNIFEFGGRRFSRPAEYFLLSQPLNIKVCIKNCIFSAAVFFLHPLDAEEPDVVKMAQLPNSSFGDVCIWRAVVVAGARISKF